MSSFRIHSSGKCAETGSVTPVQLRGDSENGLRLRTESTTDKSTGSTLFKQVNAESGKAKLNLLTGMGLGVVFGTLATWSMTMGTAVYPYEKIPAGMGLETAAVIALLPSVGIGAFLLRRPRDIVGMLIGAGVGGLSYFAYGVKNAELYAPITALITLVITNFTGRRGSK
jgi:hypothetical protein